MPRCGSALAARSTRAASTVAVTRTWRPAIVASPHDYSWHPPARRPNRAAWQGNNIGGTGTRGVVQRRVAFFLFRASTFALAAINKYFSGQRPACFGWQPNAAERVAVRIGGVYIRWPWAISNWMKFMYSPLCTAAYDTRSSSTVVAAPWRSHLLCSPSSTSTTPMKPFETAALSGLRPCAHSRARRGRGAVRP